MAPFVEEEFWGWVVMGREKERTIKGEGVGFFFLCFVLSLFEETFECGRLRRGRIRRR